MGITLSEFASIVVKYVSRLWNQDCSKYSRQSTWSYIFTSRFKVIAESFNKYLRSLHRSSALGETVSSNKVWSWTKSWSWCTVAKAHPTLAYELTLKEWKSQVWKKIEGAVWQLQRMMNDGIPRQTLTKATWERMMLSPPGGLKESCDTMDQSVKNYRQEMGWQCWKKYVKLIWWR